jgi:hypothetical protein
LKAFKSQKDVPYLLRRKNGLPSLQHQIVGRSTAAQMRDKFFCMRSCGM